MIVPQKPAVQSFKGNMAFAVALILSAFFAGYSATMVADRTMPVDIMSAEATTPFVAPGGDLRVAYTVFRRRACDVTVDRFIVDAEGTRFTLPDVNIGRGMQLGPDRYVIVVEVPQKAVPGPATYRTVTNYVCNPFHSIDPIPGGPQNVAFTVR